jgi:hypothetical protein
LGKPGGHEVPQLKPSALQVLPAAQHVFWQETGRFAGQQRSGFTSLHDSPGAQQPRPQSTGKSMGHTQFGGFGHTVFVTAL